VTPQFSEAFRQPTQISARTLCCQKLRVQAKISATDDTGLTLLVFQAVIFVARSDTRQSGEKQNLTQNSLSSSLKVLHFGILENPTTDCILLYNNAGLISKLCEEITSENAENCHC